MCGQTKCDPGTFRIIGGRDARKGEASYQVRLRYVRKQFIAGSMTDHQCGATLISSCWAVTAAHCIDHFKSAGYYTNSGGFRLNGFEIICRKFFLICF